MQAKEREVDGLVRSMEQLRLQSQEKERDNRHLQDEVRQKDEQVQQLRRELHQTSRDSEQLVATLQHSLEQKDEVIRSKDAALQEKERQIRELWQSQGDKRGSTTAAQPFVDMTQIKDESLNIDVVDDQRMAPLKVEVELEKGKAGKPVMSSFVSKSIMDTVSR